MKIDPAIVNGVSVHEAAHMLYLMRLGVTEFVITPATITMVDGHPIISNANVRPANEKLTFQTDDPILELARVFVSAGVAERMLLRVTQPGDAHDKRSFEHACRVTNVPDDAIESIWDRAVADVRRDLQNATLALEVWNKAMEIRPQIFPHQF